MCAKCAKPICATTFGSGGCEPNYRIAQAQAQVIEVRQYGAVCPSCGLEQAGQPPEGLEMNRTFGTRLGDTIVYYRQEQHLSYERTVATMKNLHGVEISQGGIDQIMQRAGKRPLTSQCDPSGDPAKRRGLLR